MTPASVLHALLLGVALLLAPPRAQAQVTAAQAETVMRQSGLWEQMEVSTAQLRMTVEQFLQDRRLGITPEQRQQLGPRLEQIMTPAAVRLRMQSHMARTLKADDLPAYGAWFGSATGQRMVAMRQKAEAEAMRMDVDAKLPLKTWHNASPTRQNLLDRVTELARAAELQVSLFNEITPAMNRLASALSGQAVSAPEPRSRLPFGIDQVDTARPMHLTLRMEYALHYEALSDEELERWIAFLESPAGARFTEASLEASVSVPLALLAELGSPAP